MLNWCHNYSIQSSHFSAREGTVCTLLRNGVVWNFGVRSLRKMSARVHSAQEIDTGYVCTLLRNGVGACTNHVDNEGGGGSLRNDHNCLHTRGRGHGSVHVDKIISVLFIGLKMR